MKMPLLTLTILILAVLITGIGSGFGAISALLFWNYIEGFNANVNPLTVSLVLFLTFFVALLYRTPAEMHKEKTEQVAELKNRWEGELAQSNLRITGVNNPTFDEKVGIEIFNVYSSHAVTIQSIRLTKLYMNTPSRPEQIENMPLHQVANALGREFNQQPIVIPARQSSSVVIAESIDDELIFRMRDDFHIRRPLMREKEVILPAKLSFELSIDGILDDGRAISTEVVSGKIEWTGYLSYRYFDETKLGYVKANPPKLLSSLQIYEVTHAPKEQTDPKVNSAQEN